MQQSLCTHELCRSNGAVHSGRWSGVGCLIIQQAHDSSIFFLGGQESRGKYAGQINTIGGKIERQHNGCAYQAAVDEICEEAKICFHASNDHLGINWISFDDCFKNGHHMQWFRAGSTVVFFCKVAGLSRRAINSCIRS